MTKTRAPLIALAAVLALFVLSAEGCSGAQPPLVKKSGSKCARAQKGKAAVDEAGDELICSGPRADGSYRWLVNPN